MWEGYLMKGTNEKNVRVARDKWIKMELWMEIAGGQFLVLLVVMGGWGRTCFESKWKWWRSYHVVVVTVIHQYGFDHVKRLKHVTTICHYLASGDVRSFVSLPPPSFCPPQWFLNSFNIAFRAWFSPQRVISIALSVRITLSTLCNSRNN